MEPAPQPSNTDLKVLFISAEADPFVRVGGLGDVSGSLPQALRALTPAEAGGKKLDVRLVIPFHGVIDPTAYELKQIAAFPIPYKSESVTARAFATQINGMPVYLVAGDPILRDAPVYSLDARLDGPKYAFFSLAALGLCQVLNWRPDIVHANDWHTALAVYSLAVLKPSQSFFSRVHSVLTIHNLAYMGNGAEGAVADFHFPTSMDPRLPDWARQMPLPMGLSAADRIVAVSPTYAQEIQTAEFGRGLQDFLQSRAPNLSGILNGIDTTFWDPAADRSPIANFTAENLAPRAVNKRALQARFSLQEAADIPLLVSIGRMSSQKGVDLAFAALRMAADQSWQAIFLGTGIPALEAEARQLENDYPDRVRAVVRFDGALSHQMYAGADVLLMPSRYEPCGLAQMIAMRYGCVPLAHATGGLVDTIRDHDSGPDGTGFLFDEETAESLYMRLSQVLNLFPDRGAWCELQLRGMRADFQWKRSALAYAHLYQDLKG